MYIFSLTDSLEDSPHDLCAAEVETIFIWIGEQSKQEWIKNLKIYNDVRFTL